MEVKGQNPGSLLLFRMGDFYELFHEDAEIASKVLGLTLTSRDLITDCGAVSSSDQFVEIILQRVVREAGHRGRIR